MLWLILGLVFGALLTFVVYRVAAGQTSVRWYQWVLGVAASLLLLLTVQNYVALQDELEPGFANLVLLFLGLPTVVLAALIWAIPAIARVNRRVPVEKPRELVKPG